MNVPDASRRTLFSRQIPELHRQAINDAAASHSLSKSTNSKSGSARSGERWNLSPTSPSHADRKGTSVVVRDPVMIVLVDPMTGNVTNEVGKLNALIAAVTTDAGDVYASVATESSKTTEVYAVPIASARPEMIGRLQERALVAAVSRDGDALLLLRYGLNGPPEPPLGVTHLFLPSNRHAGAQAARPARDLGTGILSQDGRRWFGLRAILTSQGKLAGGELTVASYADAQHPVITRLRAPVSNIDSLLLSPDGHTLYAVDYIGFDGTGRAGNQRIHVFDVSAAQPRPGKAVELDRHFAKNPLCAAALTPNGDRLYVIEDDPNAAIFNTHGIDVYDTRTWQRVARLHSADDALYGLAAAPDGTTLYASTSQGTLMTFDTLSGQETQRVMLPPDILLWLLFAT